jgi:hypothetical protein
MMTSKTIYSVGRSAGVFKFIEFKKLLEAEVVHHQRAGAVVCAVGDRGGGGAFAGAGDRAAVVAGGSGGGFGGGQVPESVSAALREFGFCLGYVAVVVCMNRCCWELLLMEGRRKLGELLAFLDSGGLCVLFLVSCFCFLFLVCCFCLLFVLKVVCAFICDVDA